MRAVTSTSIQTKRNAPDAVGMRARLLMSALTERLRPTIRRGARIGGGAVLCPGIEIGEEAFVGAGAVVTKDVPARALVVGNPARQVRDVPDEELLG